MRLHLQSYKPLARRERCLLLLLLLLLAGPAVAQAPTWQWAIQSTNPTPTDSTIAQGNSVATDATGNVYVGGQYSDFTISPVPTTRHFGNAGSSGPAIGGFVAQASAAGQWNWVRTVRAGARISGASALAYVTDVVATPAGDVYAVGFMRGDTVRVDNQIGTVNTVKGAQFVARFSSAGQCQWLRVVEGAGYRPLVALDPSTGGIVTVDSYYNVAVSFGSTTLAAPPATGQSALCVARLSASGQWLGAVAAFGNVVQHQPKAVAVSASGQVAVAGNATGGMLQFGAFSLPQSTSGWVAQLGATNQWDWAVGTIGTGTSYLTGAVYTPNGLLWVCGRGRNGAQLGSTTLATSNTNTQAGFVGQLAASGQWGMVLPLAPGLNASATFDDLALDTAGNLAVLGQYASQGFAAQTTWLGQPLTVPASLRFSFITVLNPTGQLRNLTLLPVMPRRFCLLTTSLAFDNGDNLYLTGGLAGPLTLGSSTLTGALPPEQYLYVTGDIFVSKLGQATALPARPSASATLSALACFPSPAHRAATLRLPAPAATAQPVALLDATGRAVRHCYVPARATEAPLDLTGLAPGLYLLRAGSVTGRLVIE